MNQKTTHVLSGLILFGFSSISLFFVVFSLTSFQAYQRMRQVTVGTTVYSVWGLDQLLKVRATRSSELNALRAAQDDLVQKLKAKTSEFKAAYLRLSDREIAVDMQLEPVYRYLRSVDLAFKSRNSFFEKFPDIEARFRQIPNPPPEVLAEYKKVYDDNIAALRQLGQAEGQLKSERDRLKELVQQGQKEIETSAARSELPPEVTGDNALKLMIALDEYASIRGFMRAILKVPYEFVIVLIVICSGFLGSSVHLASNFASASFTQPPSVYLTRMTLGALTSLVLFIFIQAGSMLAIDPKSLNQSVANLNPFFVSFVGIVGGLSTERVLGTLGDAVNRYLYDSSSDRARYPMPPVQALAEKADELAKFCAVTNYDPDDLKTMVLGNQPVPPRLQMALTIWLRADKRTLFTEYPPERKTEGKAAAPREAPASQAGTGTEEQTAPKP